MVLFKPQVDQTKTPAVAFAYGGWIGSYSDPILGTGS